jgi:hypothetical protein
MNDIGRLSERGSDERASASAIHNNPSPNRPIRITLMIRAFMFLFHIVSPCFLGSLQLLSLSSKSNVILHKKELDFAPKIGNQTAFESHSWSFLVSFF